jgi:hypothetical protein
MTVDFTGTKVVMGLERSKTLGRGLGEAVVLSRARDSREGKPEVGERPPEKSMGSVSNGFRSVGLLAAAGAAENGRSKEAVLWIKGGSFSKV